MDFKARSASPPRQQHHVIPNFNHQTTTTDFVIHQGGNKLSSRRRDGREFRIETRKDGGKPLRASSKWTEGQVATGQVHEGIHERKKPAGTVQPKVPSPALEYNTFSDLCRSLARSQIDGQDGVQHRVSCWMSKLRKSKTRIPWLT